MFSLARLLDAIAFSMHVDGAVHHSVDSGATEIARHVLRYLLPTVQIDAPVEKFTSDDPEKK